MPSIADYVRNIDQVLIDVAADPVFSEFIEASDRELVGVDVGGGMQAQVRALSRGSVARVLKKVIKKLKGAGAKVDFWICDPSQFNLCEKLKTTPAGQLMEQLNTFFSNKWTEAGITSAHVAVYIPALGLHPVAPFIAMFSALGFLNKFFVELCNCP
jgi:hypothetical protein